MYYNESAMMILKESHKNDCKSNTYECDLVCGEFEDTMSNIDPMNFSYTIECIPIIKKDECMKEQYYVALDMLTHIAEAYDTDEGYAYDMICEFYNLTVDSLAVVVESDDLANDIIEEAKQTKKCELVRSCNNTINNLKDKGIKIFKKESKKSKDKKKKNKKK